MILKNVLILSKILTCCLIKFISLVGPGISLVGPGRPGGSKVFFAHCASEKKIKKIKIKINK